MFLYSSENCVAFIELAVRTIVGRIDFDVEFEFKSSATMDVRAVNKIYTLKLNCVVL